MRWSWMGGAGLLALLLGWGWAASTPRVAAAQAEPTATHLGPMLSVHPGGEPQINLRAGPGRGYDAVGTLGVGQYLPALGRTPGGDWIQVAYAGGPNGVAWVYAYLCDITGDVPIVEPPPTPTPRTTPTIDPTLAAQFIVEIPPTRLPTFTPAPSLVMPTFPPQVPMTGSGGTPIGWVIIALGSVGLLGMLLSLIRRR